MGALKLHLQKAMSTSSTIRNPSFYQNSLMARSQLGVAQMGSVFSRVTLSHATVSQRYRSSNRLPRSWDEEIAGDETFYFSYPCLNIHVETLKI